jgi:acetolactate synthase-1/2/3 large subunit
MNIPVYTSLMGKGAMADSHPLHLGVCGCWGRYPAVEAARNADVILALGCRFSDLHTASWQPGFAYNIPATKLIQVDIDPSEIARNYPVDMGIVGDIKTVLNQLIDKAERAETKGDYSEWLGEVNGYKKEWEDFVTPYEACDESPIDPRRLIFDIRKAAPKDAIMFSDVGNNQPWIEEFWSSDVPGTHFTAGGFAAMGFGVCGVLGAKLAKPETTCINVCGDGGFLMMVGEINTAVRLKLPVVFVILRDRFLSLIKVKQTRKEYHRYGVEIFGPNYSSSNNFFGAKVVIARDEDDFRHAFKRALGRNEPVVIEAVVDPSEYDQIL